MLIPGSGIDIEGFEQAAANAPSPAELRARLGLGDAEVVLTVTRMTRQKGIPTLLRAAAVVHQQRPGVRFLLVGPREREGAFAVAQAEIDQHVPYVWQSGRAPMCRPYSASPMCSRFRLNCAKAYRGYCWKRLLPAFQS